MESEERGHQAHDCKIENESHNDADISGELWVIIRQEPVVETPLDGLIEVVSESESVRVSDDKNVNQKK
jgi:hypothetical protein